MDFRQAAQRFRWLERQRRTRRITELQYRTALYELRVTDDAGRLWMPQEVTGIWHVYDGTQWIPSIPPRQATQRSTQVARPASYPATKSGKPLFISMVVLGLLVFVGIGIFLAYTLPRPGSGNAVTLGQNGASLVVQGLRVEFTSAALPPGTRVSGRVVADAQSVAQAERNDPEENYRLVSPVYKVEIVNGLPLQEMIEVTLSYEPSLLGDAEPDTLSGAIWNGQTWELRPSKVDSNTSKVTFIADHFSLLAVVTVPALPEQDAIAGNRGTDSSNWVTYQPTGGRFVVYYTRNGPNTPLDNSLYIPHIAEPRPGVPAFVEDLYIFLEQAYNEIANLGYQMPPTDAPIEVVISSLSDSGVMSRLGLARARQLDGATSVAGPLYIDNNLRDDEGNLRDPKVLWRRLKPVAAHELFHYVQRYNPSFPTWFYEASAVYLEWRLYDSELPENVPMDYINPRAAFLYNGLWRGSVNDHYTKAALLIYLQDKYSGSCRDVVSQGIYPQGGSSYGLYVAGLKSVDMSQVFVQAAAKCGGFQGTWSDLFTEFALAYYADWDRWPTANSLLLGNRQTPISANREEITGYGMDVFVARFGREAGGTRVFPPFTWRDSSAASWYVSSSSYAPLATLVLQVENLSGEGAPRYWAYPTKYTETPGTLAMSDAIGPTIFHADQPTIAISNFGPRNQGGEVWEVYLVGVDDAVSLLGNSDVTVRAYLLPALEELSAKIENVVENGQEVRKLRISWKDWDAWLPEGIPNLTHQVFLTSDPTHPLGSLAGSVLMGSSDSILIPLFEGATHAAVLLADQYGNQGPPLVVELPQLGPLMPQVELGAVEEAMVAALHRLGVSDADAYNCTTNVETGYASCSYIHKAGEELVRWQELWLNITLHAKGGGVLTLNNLREMGRWQETKYQEYPALYHEGPFELGVTRPCYNVTQREVYVIAGDLQLRVLRRHFCTEEPCGECIPEPAGSLDRELEALWIEAVQAGLLTASLQ
ncbi:MAG: hypothetical protein ACYCZF_15710 [Anaerolineae bacterium]